jgi:hypothetical protein
VLTERHIRLLQKYCGKISDPEQHIESPRPGYLLCQDTYFVGTIQGVGNIYMQTVIDAHYSHVFAKLYLSKAPITAADILNDRVLPFYEDHGVTIGYCARIAATSARVCPSCAFVPTSCTRFSDHVLQRAIIERQLGHQPLQARILFAQSAHPLCIAVYPLTHPLLLAFRSFSIIPGRDYGEQVNAT